MSSREHRRRERSWERDDRDRDRGRHSRSGRGGGRGGSRPYPDEGRRRSSRSRSPRRGGDRDRRERHDPYIRDKEDDRRERDRDRDRDRDRMDGKRKEEDHRKSPRRGDVKDAGRRQLEDESRNHTAPTFTMPPPKKPTGDGVPQSRPNLDPDAPDDMPEEGETMDAENDDDMAMMAMMGVTGFGSTKGKHVEGNQEGTALVKKQRTWRQYMNRRGGFNRPLDKIK